MIQLTKFILAINRMTDVMARFLQSLGQPLSHHKFLSNSKSKALEFHKPWDMKISGSLISFSFYFIKKYSAMNLNYFDTLCIIQVFITHKQINIFIILGFFVGMHV